AHARFWRPRGPALSEAGEHEYAKALTHEARERKWPNVRPRNAATLILLDHSGGVVKVLLGRRHAGHKFMPGKFVFPGGRVERSDRQMSVARPLDSIVEDKLNARLRRPSPRFGRALALAAIRETFEETGLALGVSERAPLAPAGAWARFAATNVTPALDGLEFIARAITPPRRPKRFDTRFLVADAALIRHREPGIVGPDAELVELVWMPLEEAAGLDIPAITRIVLKELDAAMKGGMSKSRPRPFFYERNRVWRRDEL
ncbi:MAG TPA: NUDIX hydrolase, partial [Roseiarcus sp.]|nr:NUDIX hydrolase [Roseiarcus sp.]